MPDRVLVTGATGLLGREVVNAFENAGWDVAGTGLTRASPPKITKLDITDEQAVGSALDEFRPDAVVHCAANRSPDSCASDTTSARRLNVTATSSLAKATSQRGIFVLYISTAYVFSGTPGKAPYKWNDLPGPSNAYGRMKLDGEEAMLEYCEANGLGCVLRVPVLYGHVEEGKNAESAVNIIMDGLWKSQEKEVKMDDWAQQYPTNTEDVARVVADVSRHYLKVLRFKDMAEIRQLPFVLQFTGEEKMTKYEICEVFAEIMGLPMDNVVREKGGGMDEGGVQRPYDCHLDMSGLKVLGIDTRSGDFSAWWRREVRAFRH